ncbi:NAD-dependent epimerase/dehydratase family protein [Actinocatenispora rupis]|uniref:NAD-dependent epimerase n=1 Tax=Actinocatenispora rupis TaxID=519421 RepID=A0A8J3IT87_9ACTN|nr:NAD-dependent epimerase/dehydratase family protein [Actinocatenispora rupis]GID09491.1 NAD-dependent epimerase [Actinocatenispora rupis]
MSLHVIVGAGATAHATARLLVADGERVRMVSRRGGPDEPGIERTALDATDVDALTRLAEGADTVFNCAATAYHTWPETVPPLFGAIRTAAERTGAGYVMLTNLYGYGPVDDGPVTEATPQRATGPKGGTRAAMWREAKAAHDEGRVRATEVRAGQFLGAGAVSLFSIFVAPPVRAGRPALVPTELDHPHAFTAIGDAARTLVAASRNEAAWGAPWLAPTITATMRELATRYAALAGVPVPELGTLTDRELTLLGLTDPFWPELFETRFMDTGRFVVDAGHTERTLGVAASPLDEVLAEMR